VNQDSQVGNWNERRVAFQYGDDVSVVGKMIKFRVFPNYAFPHIPSLDRILAI
jgi:hypothetical protein